jgi:hypothetical protein
MTQEHKDLLLKDLCTRLPYGVKAEKYTIRMDGEFVPHANIETVTAKDILARNECPGYTIKPYLFPLSSITEEQYYELQNVSGEDCLDHMEMIKSLRECTNFTHWPLYEYRVIDWFNKNHFDYRCLISMGLAIDATDKNIY